LEINANIFFAKYLKNKFKNKKIIMGGLWGLGDNYQKNYLLQYNFIDSFVIGKGEESTKIIINNILHKKRLKKIYCNSVNYSEQFKKLPDFKSFKNLAYFNFSPKILGNFYKINHEVFDNDKKILVMPYSFSLGCFWHKCSYCNASGKLFDKKWYYYKKPDAIVQDLIKLKKEYKTKYFIFFNNNFNHNIKFAKELLRKMIKEKLGIVWTDYFNLAIIDDELIDLLPQAGCFRIDIGTTSFNPHIQKTYHNIFKNDDLKRLKKIHKKGIWININIIANVPYQYNILNEIKIIKKYIKYVDSVELNYFRLFANSDINLCPEKYNVQLIKEDTVVDGQKTILPFIEKEFRGTIEDRKKLFNKNYMQWKNFFLSNKIPVNNQDINLLEYLYDVLGFKNKEKIKKIIIQHYFK
jgi:hypothetical protein